MSLTAHIYHHAQHLFLSLPLHVFMWDCLSDHCMDHMIMCSKVGTLLINYKIMTSAMLHRSQILLYLTMQLLYHGLIMIYLVSPCG